jgi:hypothetical protein
MLLYAVATGVLCFVPLCLDQGRPMQSRHVLFSTITMFFAVRFVLPVFTMYIPAVGPIDPPGMTMSNLLPRDVAHAQSIILAGLVMLIVGYSLPVGRGLSRLVPRPRSEWTYGAALSSAVILIGLGWSLYLADQFGLLPARLGSGFIGGFTDATLFGPAILTIVYIRYRSRTALLLLLVFVPMTSFVNFFTGYKRLVLTPPAMMALTWIVAERRLRALWLVLGLVALLLLYPAAQFYREVILVGNTKTLADVGRDPSPAVAALGDFVSGNKATEYFEEGLVATGRRLDGIGHAAVIIRDTPSVSPFQHGATLALIPITYVPRMLWPGKPDTTIGAWIVDTYRIRGERIESSIGPTWVGEFYLNFGFAGVVAGMFVMGTLLRLVHESLVARSPTVLAIILEVLVLYEVMLKLTGSLATVINGPIMAMIPILLAHAIIRFFGGARPFEPGPDTGDESPAEAGFHDVPPLASAHPAGGASAEPEDR